MIVSFTLQPLGLGLFTTLTLTLTLTQPFLRAAVSLELAEISITR